MRPGANGTVTSCPAFFAACSTAAHPPRTIRSASETFFPPDCEPLNSCWISSRVCSTLASSAGSLTSQSFCGARRMRAPLAPPRLSVPRNVAADAQAVETSWEIGQSRGEDLALERGDVRLADQLVIDRGDRVLPQLRLGGTQRAEVARDRPHVAVRQLVPRLGERLGELVRVLVEALRRSARRSGPSAARGPSSASSGRAASTDRGRPARCPGPTGSLGVHCFAPAGLVVSSQS